MQLVKKIWRWSCKGQFATTVIPGVKSEETFVPSQGAIGEIKMASTLRTTPCPESPTRGLQVAASDSAIEERQSKVRSVKKVRRGCVE
jgi:hypothetical protein